MTDYRALIHEGAATSYKCMSCGEDVVRLENHTVYIHRDSTMVILRTTTHIQGNQPKVWEPGEDVMYMLMSATNGRILRRMPAVIVGPGKRYGWYRINVEDYRSKYTLRTVLSKNLVPRRICEIEGDGGYTSYSCTFLEKHDGKHSWEKQDADN